MQHLSFDLKEVGLKSGHWAIICVMYKVVIVYLKKYMHFQLTGTLYCGGYFVNASPAYLVNPYYIMYRLIHILSLKLISDCLLKSIQVKSLSNHIFARGVWELFKVDSATDF